MKNLEYDGMCFNQLAVDHTHTNDAEILALKARVANVEELFAFLQEASISLLKIDKIENYLRTVDSKNIDTTSNMAK